MAKHHFVPQVYLNGFGQALPARRKNRKRPHRIVLCDYETLKTHRPLVEDVAYKGGFYAVNESDPEGFEKALSEIESKSAECLRKARNGDTLSSSEWESLVFFIALLATRSPTHMEGVEKTFDQTAKLYERDCSDTKEADENIFLHLWLTFGEYQARHILEQYSRDGRKSIRLTSQAFVTWITSTTAHVSASLKERRVIWLQFPPDMPLLTSDTPVAQGHLPGCIGHDPLEGLDFTRAIGVIDTLPSCIVLLPLSRHLGVAFVRQDCLAPGLPSTAKAWQMHFNSAAAGYRKRYVFLHPDDEIHFQSLYPGGQVFTSD